MTRSGLLFAALCAAAPAAVWAAPVAGPSTVVVADTHAARTIDCKGADAMITGDDNTLSLSGCLNINLVGKRNRVTAQLLPDSTINALGDDNHVVFLHAPGYEAVVSSTGKNNQIVPQNLRDTPPSGR